ncbi:MAG: ThuA domain-containing protein [Planctomycetia bacterium]|nr:ThuA domain-containing protein [Planctomycetia bacterium]
MKKTFLSLFSVIFISLLSLMSTFTTAQEVTSGKPDGSVIEVLLIDGYNNHNWRETSPVLKRNLEETGLFEVTVATAPEEKKMDTFQPKFSDYDVVVLNFNDNKKNQQWSENTKKAFQDYVQNGGGVVVYHAANNAFTDWKEYNLMTAVGGWGGRNKTHGPYFYLKDGKPFHDYQSDGPCGHHGPQHEFQIILYEEHPITKGLPPKFMHVSDELYCYLRGPAENTKILAYAHSPKEKRGSGRDEPQLMVTEYGKGRIFHIAYGHAGKHCRAVSFILPFIRGTQWAATGTVTIPVPPDMPTEEKSMTRD